MPDPKHTEMLDIIFTKQDIVRLHFIQDDALVIKLTIARCYVRRILINRTV